MSPNYLKAIGENLLLSYLLEKFSNLCFGTKGAHVQCIGFKTMHDYND